jgi:hypothetical protein
MFLRSTSFGRLSKREDLCYASKLIRIFGPYGLYPLTPLARIRYHQPLNISYEVQQLPRNSGGSAVRSPMHPSARGSRFWYRPRPRASSYSKSLTFFRPSLIWPCLFLYPILFSLEPAEGRVANRRFSFLRPCSNNCSILRTTSALLASCVR